MKRILPLILAVLMLLPLTSCQPDGYVPTPDTNEDTPPLLDLATCYTTVLEPAAERTLFVQFEMDGGATFVVELYPEYAPKTVENFQNLVAEGFYNGLTFHRIYEGFMIQGGDPEGNGTGHAEDRIEGEFSANGYVGNTLSHERGVISMCRTSYDNDSASCQFFIMHADSTGLDGKYAAFGRVVAGMETIDTIAKVDVVAQISGEKSKPVTPPVMKTVTFVNYVAPTA